MSGIVIDVDTKSEAAKQDLRSINKSLAAIVNNSRVSRSALDRVNSFRANPLKRSVDQTSDALKRMSITAPRAFKGVSDGAVVASRAVSSVKTAVVSLTTAFLAFKGVGAFYRVADDLTSIQNRLSIVIDSADEVIRKQRQILKLSNDARASFAGSANMFVDFSMALQAVGVSETRILGVVKTIQQAGTLSGSSVQALEGALIQLNQGISSGTLRGEELNSVLEQMKYLAPGFKRVLGMDTGTLRRFAEEGRLTTELVLETIEALATQTDADFKKTTTTVAQASQALRQSVSFFFADLNKYYGFADRFAKLLTRMSNFFLDANSVVIGAVGGTRKAIQNYIDSFDIFSAAELTFRAMIDLDIMPWDAWDAYSQFKDTKEKLDKLRTFFSDKPIVVKAPVIKFQDPRDLELNTDMPQVNAKRPVDSFKNAMGQILALTLAVGDTVAVTVQNTLRIFPKIIGPVVMYIDSIMAYLKTKLAELSAGVYKTVIPTVRTLESLFETLTFGLIVDESRERAWVNLFKSSSMAEVISNLKALNDVRRAQIRSDTTFWIRDMVRDFRDAIWPFEQFLIALGLLNNSLIKVRSSRLDRVAKYFEIFGKSVKRVYQDVFAPNIEPIVKGVFYQVETYALALSDAFYDNINFVTGRSLARRFVNGISNGLSFLFDSLGDLESISFDNIFSASLTEKVLSGFAAILRPVGDFLRGFFGAIGEAFVDTMPRSFERAVGKVIDLTEKAITKLSSMMGVLRRYSLGDMISNLDLNLNVKSNLGTIKLQVIELFDSVHEGAQQGIRKTIKLISGFGEKVKDIFFDVYDKVVGHSYWPDTIDGVLEHTKRLSSVESYFVSFGKLVKKVFSNIFESSMNLGGGVGEAVREFTIAMKSVNWGDAMDTLAKSAGASMVAALLYSFGDMRLKLTAVGYFLSLFNVAIGGALDSFGELFANTIGKSAGAFTERMIDSFINSFDRIIVMAPEFVKSLLSAVNPVLSSIISAYESVPYIPIVTDILSNNLLSAIGVATLGYALLVKNGTKQIKELAFGKAGKAGKDGKPDKAGTDGILSHITPLFTSSKKESSRGDPGFLDSLYGGKKMAAAIAATFTSAAIFESISIIDAAMVGIPLLGYALLGKDGGGRLLKKTYSLVESVIAGVYMVGLSLVERFSGKDSLLSGFFRIPLNVYKSLTTDTKGPLGAAFAELTGQFRQGFKNLRTNSAKYAAGEMSLISAFMTTGGLKGVSAGSSRWQQPDLFDTGQMELFNTNSENLVKDLSKLRLRESFQNVLDKMLDVKFKGKTIRQYFTSFKSVIVSSFSDIRETFSQLNLNGLFAGGFSNVIPALKRQFSDMSGTIATGLAAIAGLLKNKFVIGALLAGFGTFAFAASDATTAVSGLVSAVGSLVTVLGLLTVTALGVGKGVQLSNVFTKAKNQAVALERAATDFSKKQVDLQVGADIVAFKANTKAQSAQRRKAAEAIFEADSEKLARTYDDKITRAYARGLGNTDIAFMRQAGLNEQAKLLAKFERDFRLSEAALLAGGISSIRSTGASRQRQLDDDFKLKEKTVGNAAGKAALMAELTKMANFAKSSLRGIAMGAAAAIASPAVVIGSIAKRMSRVREAADDIALASTAGYKLSAALDSIVASFALMRVGKMVEGFRLLAGAIGSVHISALGLLFASVGKDFASFGKLLLGMIATIGKGIASLSALLWPLIKIPALVGGALTAVGALGLWLFGPGVSFFDNLEWAYDKIRSIFGLQAKTQGGRIAELASSLGPRDIAGQQADFSKDLSRVDASKLSSVQFDVLNENAKGTKEAFDSLEKLFVKQGYLTTAQVSEFERVKTEMTQLLLRQPSQEKQPFSEALKELSKEILAVDNSAWQLIKRFAGWRPILDETAMASNGFEKAIVSISGFIGRFFDANVLTWTTAVTTAVGAFGGPAGVALGLSVGILLSSLFNTLGNVVSSAANSLSGGFATALDVITGAAGKVGPALAALTGPFAGMFTGIGLGLTEAVQSFMIDFDRAFSIAPSLEALEEDKWLKDVTEATSKYFDLLPVEVQKGLEESLQAYRGTRKQYFDLKDPGFTGTNADDIQDYGEKLRLAEVNFRKARADFGEASQVWGLEGAMKSDIMALNKDMKEISASAKSLLDLDLGEFMDKFLGNDAELQTLKDSIEAATKLSYDLTRARTRAARVDIQIQQEQLKERKKQALEKINAGLTFEGDIEYRIKVSGLDLAQADVRSLRFGYEAAYVEFVKLTDEIEGIQTRLKQALKDQDPKQIKEAFEALGKLQRDALQNMPASTWLSDLNTGLQGVGKEGIAATVFTLYSEDEARNLGELLKSVKVKQQELLNLANTGKPFEQQIKALEDIIRLTAQIDKNLKDTANRKLVDINLEDKSPLDKAIAAAQVTGATIPTPVLGSESRLNRFNRLTSNKAGLELAKSELDLQVASGQSVDPKVYTAIRRQIDLTDEALARMAEQTTFTLDNLLGRLSETGFDVDLDLFSSLDSDARISLNALGKEIEAMSQSLSEGSSDRFTGASVQTLSRKMSEKLSQAEAIIAKGLGKTGKGLTQIFENLGIPLESTVNLADEYLKKVPALFIEALRLDKALNKANSPQAFVEAYKERLKLTKQINREVENSVKDLETLNSRVNSAFNVNFTLPEFASLPDNVAASLVRTAKFFEANLQSIKDTGRAISGETAKTFFEKFEDSLKKVKFVKFFTDLSKSLSDAYTSGLGEQFERFSSAIQGLDKFAFSAIDETPRRQLTEEAIRLQALTDLTNMSLPDEFKEILLGIERDESTADILKAVETLAMSTDVELPAEFKKWLENPEGKSENLLALDQNSSSLNLLTTAVNDLRSFFQGSPKSLGIPSGIPSVTSFESLKPGAPARRFGNFEDFSRRTSEGLDRRTREQEFRASSMVPGAAGLAARARASDVSGFDRIRFLGLPESIQKNVQESIDKAYEMVRASQRSPENGELQRRADQMVYDAQRLVDRSFMRFTDSMGQLGEDFARNVKDSVYSSFVSAFKGERDEGKNVFETLAGRLLDRLTSSVIEAFTSGFAEAIFGKDGFNIESLISDFGKDLATNARDLLLGKLTTKAAPTGGQVGPGSGDSGDDITGAIGADGASPWDGFLSMFDNFSFEGIVSKIKESFGSLASNFSSLLSGMDLGSIVKSISGAFSSLMSWFGGGSSGLPPVAAIAGAFATGGYVSGKGTGTSDSIPAMLSNGEYVINARSTKQFAPLLKSINEGRISKRAAGGLMQTAEISSSDNKLLSLTSVDRGASQQVINVNITGDISRQTRSEIYSMLPQIAGGVNSYNREKGYKG